MQGVACRLAVATALAGAVALVATVQSTATLEPDGRARRAATQELVRATIAFDERRVQGSATPTLLVNPRLEIFRDNRLVYAGAVPRRVNGRAVSTVALLQRARIPYFVVRDLDADGEPEVVLTLRTTGTSCCAWSRIYAYAPHRRTYRPADVFWGVIRAVPALRDLDRDGRAEFVGRDGRFARLPLPDAEVIEPLRIWRYQGGRLLVVTMRFPALLTRDTTRLWAAVERARRARRSLRPALTAWMASSYALGRSRAVDDTLAGLLRRRLLAPTATDPPPRAPLAWVRSTKRFLAGLGYTPRAG